MAKRLLLGTVLGGLVVYVWGAISWMVLPWHTATFQAFSNEEVVVTLLQLTATKPGVYLLPKAGGSASEQKAAHERMKQGPVMLAAIRPQGANPSDPMFYVKGLALELCGAFLMTWLIMTLPGMSFSARVRTVTLVALIAGVLTRVPDWHWWGFSAGYTIVQMLDLLIGYFLAGLVIAKVTTPKPSAS